MAEKKTKKETKAAEAKADEVKETKKELSLFESLLYIQQNLNAPKGQTNTFGDYKYRSLEDINEALKPLLRDVGCVFVTEDELVMIGERYYIKATAHLIKASDNAKVSNTAYAREELQKKGMDASQITGTASSYARKYAANGLFAIDDTKDADTDSFARGTRQNKEQERTSYTPKIICPKCGDEIKATRGSSGAVLPPNEVLKQLGACPDCFKAERDKKDPLDDIQTGAELAEQQAVGGK